MPHVKDSQWVRSMAAAAEVLNVDLSLIKAAKRHSSFQQCFHVNGKVNVEELKILLPQYEIELRESAEDIGGLAEWKTRKTKADALMAEIELEELKKKYLQKEEVIAFLKQIASSQRALLKSKMVHELPSKLLGLNVTEMSVLMENELASILSIFQEGISKWS